MAGQPRRGRLRAPARHGQALTAPPIAKAVKLLESNRPLAAADGDLDFGGKPLAQVRREARALLLEDAGRYSLAYRDVNAPRSKSAQPPIVMGGHQPQLFHPGVWFKSFVLSRLAELTGGAAVNLIVDNDLAPAPAVRVPVGGLDQPRLDTIAYDVAGSAAPIEETEIHDNALFASFGGRAASAIEPLVADPLVRRLWPLAIEASARQGNLGLCLAQARHSLERACGLDTLEAPLSRICTAAPFFRFLAALVARAEPLREIYNDSLQQYRRANRIRSRSHPAPELAADDGWTEAPFWIWSADDPLRRRLFVRRDGDRVQLTDRANRRQSITAPDGNAERSIEQLAELSAQGVKLRPRALLTTMYCRLVLCDLFVHGIGGAKYDELTDHIISRFWRIEPPAFMTTTATIQLPHGDTVIEPDALRNVGRQLRELRFHPEKHAASSENTERLAAIKKKWTAVQLPRGQRQKRHREIERVNLELQPVVEKQREMLLAEQRRLEDAARNQAMLGSREYSFCLHSAETLPALLLDLSSR